VTVTNGVALVEAAMGKPWESDALPAIEAGVASLPPEVAFAFGDQARRKKWFKCAERLLTAAADGLGDQTAIHVGLVECRSNLQMWQEAAKAADNALARDPKNRRVIRAKARILWKLGRSKEAIALLRKYSSLAKSWSEPWLDMARVQASIGDWKGARQSANEAIKRGAEGEEVRTIAVDACVALQDHEGVFGHASALARQQPALIARWVRMYQSLDEPIVAVHVARALVAARGVGTDVERSLYRLEGRLRSANEQLSSPAVREALGVLASQDLSK